jgi:UDP-3-O-[3-hydroxymyristoyl] glucosamine N-acyltransferase LpxD
MAVRWILREGLSKQGELDLFKFNVMEINSNYDFVVNRVSSLVNPHDNSIMFLTNKNLEESTSISKCSNCLIFVPNDFKGEEEYLEKHCIVVSGNPRLDYALLVNSLLKNRMFSSDFDIKGGSYIGANVSIGSNVVIESFCFIHGDVVIGDNAVIKSGVKINGKVVIGKNCIIRENTVIGTAGFGFVKDDYGNYIRFPFLGGIRIGDNVEIGALCNIENAIADETIIGNYTKLDSMTFVGHDVSIGENSLIIAPKLAGHVVIGKDAFIGFGSTIRQRVTIGDGAQIGLGAAVVKDVPAGETVVGNPAKPINKND